MDVRVSGAEQLVALARAAKAVDGQIRRDMLRELRTAGKRMIPDVQDAARDMLPSSGGLNEFVASSKYAVRTRTTGSSAGVRVTGTKAGHDIAAINDGTVRHPVFDTGAWVAQSVTPGFWDEGTGRSAPQVRMDLLGVLEEINRRIARSV